ncbi:hypothetical protein [Plantactinospora sp. GCM10030261]|uniref:hypothetical protein n=1 Tax=Plantactinospora sp. GCM10030261 TaxID=3273420 RepID=UPI00360983E5
MRWSEYADAARGLAAIRAEEGARRAAVGKRTADGRAAVEQLRQRLTAQRDYLAGLATRLGEPPPSFEGVARAGLTDVDEALRRAWQAVEQADVEARRAEDRGNQPALLPGMSTTGRNVLVYAAATFVAWLVSLGLYVFSPDAGTGSVGLLAWSLCGLPAVAFFAGYTTIAVFGRPRLRPGATASHSVRLGGLICFVGMWAGWVLFLAATSLL